MMITVLSPALRELPLTTQRAFQRALFLLEQHLRQPDVSLTSANATRDWLRLHMARLEREEFRFLFLDN
jgi:DNA repair protein RadC